MRSLRLMAVMLALALVAAACGDDAEEPAASEQVTTTTRSVAPVVDEPSETTTPTTSPTLPPTTEPPAPVETLPPEELEPTVTEPPGDAVAPPAPPSNVRCVPGANEGELLVEFDALPDASSVSTIRVYAGPTGERPLPRNGEFTMGQVDTGRSGGTRWAVPARGLPTGITLDLTATSFNLLDEESGWYIVQGVSRGPGQSCAADGLPPPTGTAGFTEEEAEPSP